MSKLQIEITGEKITEKRGLIVKIGKSETVVTSLASAANKYRNFIEENFLGASEAPVCKVRECNEKKFFATISYNGRVWAA